MSANEVPAVFEDQLADHARQLRAAYAASLRQTLQAQAGAISIKRLLAQLQIGAKSRTFFGAALDELIRTGELEHCSVQRGAPGMRLAQPVTNTSAPTVTKTRGSKAAAKTSSALGGYDEALLMAEDVHFLRRLQKLGRARRQRFVRLRGVKTITSARKFDRHGDWHFFTRIPGLLWRFLRRGRGAVEEFAQRYWYKDR